MADIPASVAELKTSLRRHYRALRREIDDPEQRSQQMWDRLAATDVYGTAGRVMVFDSIHGEPITAEWKTNMVDDGKQVWAPEDDDLPFDVDLVIVPGLAFTPDGDRLGQGGGWYDRYLAGLPSSSTRIGVCFEAQLADQLPVESHDIAMDALITERRIIWCDDIDSFDQH